MLHQHLKTAHIWDTVSIPCGVVTSNRSAVSCQVLQLLSDIHGVGATR